MSATICYCRLSGGTTGALCVTRTAANALKTKRREVGIDSCLKLAVHRHGRLQRCEFSEEARAKRTNLTMSAHFSYAGPDGSSQVTAILLSCCRSEAGRLATMPQTAAADGDTAIAKRFSTLSFIATRCLTFFLN